MTPSARRILAFLLALGVFALDRWSKSLVVSNLNSIDTIPVVPGLFNIIRSENPGVAFGMFAESTSQYRTAILISISIAAVFLLFMLLWRIDRLDSRASFGLALIFGGALGNVFDRISFGSVTDFFDFYVGTYHWYTFNVADVAICTGAGLLLLSSLFPDRRPNSQQVPKKTEVIL